MIPSPPEQRAAHDPPKRVVGHKGGLLEFILQYTPHAHVLPGQRALGGSGICVLRLR